QCLEPWLRKEVVADPHRVEDPGLIGDDSRVDQFIDGQSKKHTTIRQAQADVYRSSVVALRHPHPTPTLIAADVTGASPNMPYGPSPGEPMSRANWLRSTDSVLTGELTRLPEVPQHEIREHPRLGLGVRERDPVRTERPDASGRPVHHGRHAARAAATGIE